MAEKQVYEVPQVVTYTDAEILEELGEAQAYGVVPTTEPPADNGGGLS